MKKSDWINVLVTIIALIIGCVIVWFCFADTFDGYISSNIDQSKFTDITTYRLSGFTPTTLIKVIKDNDTGVEYIAIISTKGVTGLSTYITPRIDKNGNPVVR